MKTKKIKVRKIDMYDRRHRQSRVSAYASAYYYPKLGVVWATRKSRAVPDFWEFQLTGRDNHKWKVPKTAEDIKKAVTFNTGYDVEVGPLITMTVPAEFADKSFRALQDDIFVLHDQESEFDEDEYDEDDLVFEADDD